MTFLSLARVVTVVLVVTVTTCIDSVSTLTVNENTSRRVFFSSAAAGSVFLSQKDDFAAQQRQRQRQHQLYPNSFAAYQIKPDTSEKLNPSLVSLPPKKLIEKLSKTTGAVWLGEHHNAQRDHDLQCEIIHELHDREQRKKKGRRPMAIGLEQIQIQFQPVLDDFLSSEINLDEMRRRVEWDKRWTWPFAKYSGIFLTARELSIPLLALNVDSEDLLLVEKEGLRGLSRGTLDKYIVDARGFASFTQPSSFRCYVDYVIRPSYEIHDQLGLLNYTNTGVKLERPMSFLNFYSVRVLWDECMASRAFAWTKSNPGGLLIGLVGADHVKFRNGIPARYDRLDANTRQTKKNDDTVTSNSTISPRSTSVLLNPSLIDSSRSGSVLMSENSYEPEKMTLQIGYAKDGVDSSSDARFLRENFGGVLPLADYILLTAKMVT